MPQAVTDAGKCRLYRVTSSLTTQREQFCLKDSTLADVSLLEAGLYFVLSSTLIDWKRPNSYYEEQFALKVQQLNVIIRSLTEPVNGGIGL